MRQSFVNRSLQRLQLRSHFTDSHCKRDLKEPQVMSWVTGHITAQNMIIKMYVQSYLGNDWVIAFSPQAALPTCSVPGTRWLLPEFTGNSSEGERAVPVSVSTAPAAGVHWASRWQLWSLTSQSFIEQGQPQRVVMRFPFRSGYSGNWQGKALIRKTSRSPFTLGCFDRAVTVFPQAGSSGRNIEWKNPFCSMFNINNSYH